MKKSAWIALTLILLVAPLSLSLRGSEDLKAVFESGDTAKILAMLAADPKLLSSDMEAGMTPLHYGAYYGYVSVVDYALKNGADLQAKDRRGLPPVWFSVSGNRPAMLRKLIGLGADLTARNSEGENLLFRAIRAGNVETVQILLDNGFRADEKHPSGMTPIEWALNGGALDIVKLLVERGAALKPSSDTGLPLLHRAAISRRAEVVHYLLDHGMDINARQPERGTALLMAVDFGNREGARALIMRGADVNAADENGLTPLAAAVKKGDRELVDLLLARGAAAGTGDPRTGKTLLHEAALRGYAGVVETLLARGVDKNAKDRHGRTALSYALKYGNKASAEALRHAGVEDAAWETNLDDAAFLKKDLRSGEALIWYLRHSGWAVKTKSALLVFDYWDDDPAPDEKLLSNGHINPEALKGLPVYVFATHEHGDHFDRQVLEWKKTAPDITYVFGFDAGGEAGAVVLPPRTERTIGPLRVTTIKANDAGVGFAVRVDGLTIFHAGDHSNNKVETNGNDFYPEVDFLASKGVRPDIAFFLNMYGCGSTNPEAFQKGIFTAVDKLKIKSVFPMHAANKEWVYGDLVSGVAKAGIKVRVGAAVNQGDRFFFGKGRLAD